MVVNRDREVPIPPAAVNETFKANLVELIHRLGGTIPVRRIACTMECGFCDMTRADCTR